MNSRNIHPNAMPIIETLREGVEPHITALLVFGSALTEGFTEDSDVDVGLFFGARYTLEKAEEFFLRGLREEFGRRIDVIIMDTADPIILMQIFENGKMLHCSNRREYELFQAQKVSQYIDLKRTRAPVEATLTKGSIYDKK